MTLLIFLLSAVPPKAVRVDAVILALLPLQQLLTAPRRLLWGAWPGETTPGMLLWLLTPVNSLVWGVVLAMLRAWWRRAIT